MNEYKILIPWINNHGNKITSNEFRLWETDLIEAFGGFTCGATVSGLWKNSDDVCIADRLVPYYVAIEPDKLDTLKEFVRYAGVLFDQDCIYFAESARNVELIAAE